MPISDREFTALIRKATLLAQRSSEALSQLGDAFIERYGIHYSDLDVDEIIDAIDYAHGSTISLAKCDAEMTAAGYPPRKEGVPAD